MRKGKISYYFIRRVRLERGHIPATQKVKRGEKEKSFA